MEKITFNQLKNMIMNDLLKERKILFKNLGTPKEEQELCFVGIKEDFKECKDLNDLFDMLHSIGLDHGNDIPHFLMSFFVKKQRK